ncbi:MAG: OadG family protein [Lachnospiraceae bacterium]|nr:OadG family protein [Lachnospiraceae bacterium]
MKMKKIALLFSMLAVPFALTACSSGTTEVSFDYTETDIIYNTVYQANQIDNIDEAYRAYLEDQSEDNSMAEVLLTGVSNFDSAREDCGDFVGYRAQDDSVLNIDISKLSNAQTEEEFYAAQDEMNSFLSNVWYVIEEDNSGDVIVNLKAVYKDRDATYSFVYEENPEAAYAYELTGQSANPYKIKEITVTPDYSMKEIMGKAAANTLMGMGTVFIVLIFISIIIGQFEKVGKLANKISNSWANKGIDDEATSSESISKSADNVVSPQGVSPMDDGELVAVITAAVVAANVAGGGSDNLIVRSIRRAGR